MAHGGRDSVGRGARRIVALLFTLIVAGGGAEAEFRRWTFLEAGVRGMSGVDCGTWEFSLLSEVAVLRAYDTLPLSSSKRILLP